MKTNKVLPIVAASLLLQSTTGSAEFKLGNFDLTAGVGVGFQLTNGAENQSGYFTKYRDYRDSFLGNAWFTAESEGYFMDFAANRIGLDDQSYNLNGGTFGGVKYNLFYDSLIHNYSVGNKSFFTGVGTGSLVFDDAVVGSTTPTNADLWPTSFDYSTKTKTFGVKATYPASGNYYLTLGYANVDRDGIRPSLAGNLGTSPGGGAVELPEPIDYKTNNFMATVGYRGDDFLAVLDGTLSNFDNNINFLNWRLPGTAATTTASVTSLAPDNRYWTLDGKTAWHNLPLNSTFAAKLGYSRITNSEALPTTIGNQTGTAVDLTNVMSDTTFNGDYRYGSASVAYSSNPIEKLDSKVFYNFLRKWNKSDQIAYTGASSATNKLFDYYKHNAGVDVGYKLPFDTKIGAGYEYLKVHRNREDAAATSDGIISVEAKNNSLDFLTAKVKYQHLTRTSEFENSAVGTDASDNNYVKRFARFFDATDKKQDKAALEVDVMPIEHLDLGLGASYQFSKYNEDLLIIGRTKDTGREYFADLTYEMPKTFRFNAFGYFGMNTFLSNHWAQGASPNNLDITLPATDKNYLWTGDLEFRTWGYSLGLDIPVIDQKWDIGVGFKQDRGDGRASFVSTRPTAVDNPTVTEYDDYLVNTLTAKTRYQFTDELGFSLGYIYEKRTFEDIAYDNYLYVSGSTSARNYLTGAGADNDYSAHVGYLVAEYRF